MIQSQSLVDYERFRTAKVVIFIDSSNPAKAYQLLAAHGEAIERMVAFFSARVLMAEQGRLQAETIVESEVADAWILLVTDGRNRALSTKKNPQRINVDARDDWEVHAFKEILRQIRESTQILEEVTAHYSRFNLPREGAARSLTSSGPG